MIATQPTRSLAKLLSHPLRVKTLIALTERKASCAELAKDFNVDPGTLAWHMEQLKDAKAIRLIESKPAKGSTEHFYRAITRAEVTNGENSDLSDAERLDFSKIIVQLGMADASLSIEAETFAQRSDHSVIRFPTNVDEQGWKDLNEAAGEFLDRAYSIEAESAGRGGGDIPVRVVALVFEMPRKSRASKSNEKSSKRLLNASRTGVPTRMNTSAKSGISTATLSGSQTSSTPFQRNPHSHE